MLDKNGWGPRVALEWRARPNTVLRAGAGITTLLTQSLPGQLSHRQHAFVVYPRLTASARRAHPVRPTASLRSNCRQSIPPSGSPIFASGNSKQVPGNTVMDVLRFEQDLAALSPNHQITPLTISGIAPNFQNGYIGTWTAGLEQKLGGATLNAAYVGTAGIKLPVTDYPNGYAGASPAFAPYTQFDSSGQITGGYGPVNLMTNRSHSTYHALQLSAQKDLTASGLGFQASYTFSKSIDDTSAVFGGFVSGYSGAVAQTAPQNPFDTRADKAPSNFDIKHALAFSLFQDLHADRSPFLRILGKKLTAGWQLLGIGTFMSGLPFTVYSGDAADRRGRGKYRPARPDRQPDLSTSRTVREDYFGLGANNSLVSFRIPADRPNRAFGTLGRNTFRGPGLHDFDMALIKDTPLVTNAQGEVASLQFRAEFFNVFNFVNFGLPSNIVLGPGFGEISRTAGTSRQIQFSLKLIY